MWADAPIPAEQILDGEPVTRSWKLHSAHRGGVSMNYWDCTAGRFHWHYAGDEMVQILEGEVHITDADGHRRTLRTGDTAHFEAGTTLLWEVPEYVRKLAFHRSANTLADRVLTKATRMPATQRVAAVAAATGALALPVAAVL